MRNSIFTEEQDSILRKNYPTKGATYCLDMIGEETGKWFSYKQIRNRIKRLGLTINDGVKILPPQNSPKTLWLEMPLDFTGPGFHKCGSFLIISYTGFQQRDRKTKKSEHVYKVKCLRCGHECERLQTSVVRAARKGAKGCKECSKEHYEKRKLELERVTEALKARAEWVELMKQIPVIPLEMVPEEKRFDSQRLL